MFALLSSAGSFTKISYSLSESFTIFSSLEFGFALTLIIILNTHCIQSLRRGWPSSFHFSSADYSRVTILRNGIYSMSYSIYYLIAHPTTNIKLAGINVLPVKISVRKFSFSACILSHYFISDN